MFSCSGVLARVEACDRRLGPESLWLETKVLSLPVLLMIVLATDFSRFRATSWFKFLGIGKRRSLVADIRTVFSGVSSVVLVASVSGVPGMLLTGVNSEISENIGLEIENIVGGISS